MTGAPDEDAQDHRRPGAMPERGRVAMGDADAKAAKRALRAGAVDVVKK
jgi:hypothetical protein